VKGAVAAMVRGLAIDFAGRNITVNNLQPGPTATDMNPHDGPHSSAVRTLVPLGRFGLAEEIATPRKRRPACGASEEETQCRDAGP
jgi:3-oxoacyl-[acyl-carrier protein] reductase